MWRAASGVLLPRSQNLREITAAAERSKDAATWQWLVSRVYMCSDTDEITPLESVLAHGKDAKRLGYDVRMEIFRDLQHVSHARAEPERYWTAVQRLWDDTRSVKASFHPHYMSEPDTLAYMTDDFALPRWNTQQPNDGLSSSAQAAQSAAQASAYMYGPGPPPPSGVPNNRLPAMQQSPTSASRQPCINQLLDENQQYAMNSAAYTPPGPALSRSASFGGAVGAGSRARHHHMQEDFEGAFNVDPVSPQRQAAQNVSQHTQNSLYSPSVAYHQSPATSSTRTHLSKTSTTRQFDSNARSTGASCVHGARANPIHHASSYLTSIRILARAWCAMA
ncbi:hypothetical protein BC835DRAFT_1456025 [Cytidiella melzeri]|nr:hypothetical protein BC835DRAFT_1456025 [Cytidiella melzeri]